MRDNKRRSGETLCGLPTEASVSETPAIFHKLIDMGFLTRLRGIYHTPPRPNPLDRKIVTAGRNNFAPSLPLTTWKEFPLNDTKKQQGNKLNQDDKKNDQGQNPQKGQQGQHNQHSQHGQ
jgi:hypothetical protein